MKPSVEARSLTLRNLSAPATLVSGFDHGAPDPQTGLVRLDLAIRNGKLAIADPAEPGQDAGGRIILPGFVDAHVHLDKAFSVYRTGFATEGLGSAVALSMADAGQRTEDDIARRMQRALAAAERNNTVAMRTHLDTFDAPLSSPAWAAFRAIRTEWKDRIRLQAVALMALFRVEGEDFDTRCRQLAEIGGVLGAFIAPGATSKPRLERLLAAADAHGLDLDLHVDETLAADADGLRLLADIALQRGHKGRITAGHCCALSAMEDNSRLIDRVAEAGISVIALPLTNGFLQDRRAGRTPRQRGIAPVHELDAAGIATCFASDNVRDAFYPYGDFDMVEVLRQAHLLAHLENAPAHWAPSVHWRAAEIMGLADCGWIRPGDDADCAIFEARDWADLFASSGMRRTVLRKGRPLSGGLFDIAMQESGWRASA